jgi:hypothetical protein
MLMLGVGLKDSIYLEADAPEKRSTNAERVSVSLNPERE